MDYYIYVFVRMNMLPVQVLVQACHVSQEVGLAMHKHPITPNMVVFGVKDESDLRKVQKLISTNLVESRSFYEPDMGNSLTAVATLPLRKDDVKRELFKKYKLLPAFIHSRK